MLLSGCPLPLRKMQVCNTPPSHVVLKLVISMIGNQGKVREDDEVPVFVLGITFASVYIHIWNSLSIFLLAKKRPKNKIQRNNSTKEPGPPLAPWLPPIFFLSSFFFLKKK
jgi:hypothetical protein